LWQAAAPGINTPGPKKLSHQKEECLVPELRVVLEYKVRGDELGVSARLSLELACLKMMAHRNLAVRRKPASFGRQSAIRSRIKEGYLNV
jgi:hypothetical protein